MLRRLPHKASGSENHPDLPLPNTNETVPFRLALYWFVIEWMNADGSWCRLCHLNLKFMFFPLGLALIV